MTDSLFLSRLESNAVLIADGATGTNLQSRGLPRGVPSDTWVLERPDQILALHRDFIEAGADILLTCTFGGTHPRLKASGLAEQAGAINRRAVDLARQAAQGTQVLVAGSMGPTGELLEPFGPLSAGDAQAAFAEQARTLSEAGVDALVIETQFDLGEARAAVEGARSASRLPIVVSFSYDRGTRTMMGVRPTQMAKEMEALGVDLLGINCGRSPEENLKALQELRQATRLPIWFKPNAGLPHTDDDDHTLYDLTPEAMGAQAVEWVASGARVIGGCCGTSPAHLRQIALAARPA